MAESHRKLIRNRRNISWYKQHSDFWAWYKYFTDNGNQEAVSRNEPANAVYSSLQLEELLYSRNPEGGAVEL